MTIPSGTLPDATSWATNGMVCTVDALASQAGLALLRAGGSAADAAVGASAVLAVTTQHMCGMGGDLVALVHPGGTATVESLLAIGRAGSGSDPGRLRAAGHTRMPLRGDVASVTMPGCVDGWLALHDRHGRLELSEVLAAAASYAEQGFPVGPTLATAVRTVTGLYPDLTAAGVPAPGDVRRRPGIARSLRAIGIDGRSAWYGGEFGRGLLEVGGGLFSATDLESDSAEWAVPLSAPAFGGTVYTTGAPTQGYVVATAAALAESASADRIEPTDPQWAHLLIEAARHAGHDRPSRLYDGALDLLADIDERASRIDPDRASPLPVPTGAGGTVYLSVVDRDGMAVSLSQSNASGFGALITVPAVGVFLQNRGIGFSLRPGHPAELRPGARPPHTLAPALLTSASGTAAVVVGTMGGDAQPQVVLQLLARLAWAHQSPAAALAAARFALVGPADTGFDTWEPGPGGAPAPSVSLEAGSPGAWYTGLRDRGHTVVGSSARSGFGHAQVVCCEDRAGTRVLGGAADPRSGSGIAAGW